MARGGGPREREPRPISEAYRRRVERRLGMSYEMALSRGISLQRARGHRPVLREGVRVAGEKAPLEQRRREKGQLSDTERRFLKNQIRKDSRYRPDAEKRDRAEQARRAFTAMSPGQRAQLMQAQRNLASGYKARKRAARRARASRARRTGRIGGGVGPVGSDYGGFGGFGGYDYGGEAAFTDWWEDEFPDLDDGSELLIYYH